MDLRVIITDSAYMMNSKPIEVRKELLTIDLNSAKVSLNKYVNL